MIGPFFSVLVLESTKMVTICGTTAHTSLPNSKNSKFIYLLITGARVNINLISVIF